MKYVRGMCQQKLYLVLSARIPMQEILFIYFQRKIRSDNLNSIIAVKLLSLNRYNRGHFLFKHIYYLFINVNYTKKNPFFDFSSKELRLYFKYIF